MKRICLLIAFLWSFAPVLAQDLPRNYDPALTDQVGPLAVIPVVDSGWTTPTFTNDCVSGWANDSWSLQLSSIRDLTVSVEDCCCPGDYFEVYVDDRLIGTTPVPSAWGCSQSGSLSSGAFTVTLCPGTHSIRVRDAGFDGHSPDEIQREFMCPAGFTVSGSLSAPSASSRIEASSADSLKPQSLQYDAARADELEAQLAEVEPFIFLDDHGMQRLQSGEARQAGVSAEALGLAHRMIALNNRIILAAQRDEEIELTPADFAFIEPLFLKQALSQTDPCGDRNNPAPCPTRVNSGRFFATEDDVRRHLESQGYHRTARYASGGAFGIDYTKVVSHPCGGSSFRDQAIIRQQGQCWTYNTQGPEPNPEVLSYIWPRLNWVGYVRWWHLSFC